MILQPGDVILGKHRIEELVGRGEFAEVYRAMHLELKVARAVKVLRSGAPGVDDSVFAEYKRRYRQEFELAAKLDHPNVIKVYDLGEENGVLYAILEYADLGSLADTLKKYGPLPIERAIRILSECAEGLDALHEKLGVIHRDITPSNILLTEEGRAKISDLGLAQVGGGHSSMRTVLGSAAGMHPGTPNYRSPEHNSWEPLTPTSDVYSLGCVAFEMLTGQVWKQVRHKVERVRDLRPDVPEWLDNIVARMLLETPGLRVSDADDPQKRYVTARAVVLALQEGIRTGTQKSPPPAPEKIYPSRKRSIIPLSVVGGCLGLLLILIISLWSISALVSNFSLTSAFHTPTLSQTQTIVPLSSTQQTSSLTVSPPLMFSATPSPTSTTSPTPRMPTVTSTTRVLPTLTPTPSRTSIPATPTTSIIYKAPVLFDPPDGATKTKETILRWTWEGSLKADEVFDVMVWRESEQPSSIGTTREKTFYINFATWKYANIWGKFYWTVRIKNQSGVWLSPGHGPFLLIVQEFVSPAPPPSAPPPPPTKIVSPSAYLLGTPSGTQIMGTGGVLGFGIILGLLLLYRKERPLR